MDKLSSLILSLFFYCVQEVVQAYTFGSIFNAIFNKNKGRPPAPPAPPAGSGGAGAAGSGGAGAAGSGGPGAAGGGGPGAAGGGGPGAAGGGGAGAAGGGGAGAAGGCGPVAAGGPPDHAREANAYSSFNIDASICTTYVILSLYHNLHFFRRCC